MAKTTSPAAANDDTPPGPNTTLFLDIGGVLLTDGWNHHSRRAAAEKFHLDYDDMEQRHQQNFPTFEEGKLTLEQYLSRVVFNEDRPFGRDEFRDFIFAQSQPFPDMIDLAIRLKAAYRLRIFAVSNEGRELNLYRIGKFKLASFVDAFISSSFVHLRKPDVEIYRLALDLSQAQVEEVVYIENTPLLAEIGEEIGIRTILHKEYASTREQLAALGLT
jgi:putative hydrolase of the HAD superfamily